MKISVHDLLHCLGKAAEMEEQYKLTAIAGDGFHRSTNILVRIAQEYMRLDIRQYDITEKVGSGTVRGACVIYENYVEIYLRPEENYCRRRFALTKELFHALVNHERFWNLNIPEHIENSTVDNPDITPAAEAAAAAEIYAEIAAMEFLFPYRERLAQIPKDGSNVNYRLVAEIYRVPQVLVEKYMSLPWIAFLKTFSAVASNSTL